MTMTGALEKRNDKLNDYDAETSKMAAAVWVGWSKLADELDAVNGKAQAHTYNVAHVTRVIENAEARMRKHNVAMTNRKGVTIIARSGVPTAKSYARVGSRTAIATRVKLERSSGYWFVREVAREERYTGTGGHEWIAWTLPEATRQAICANALADF